MFKILNLTLLSSLALTIALKAVISFFFLVGFLAGALRFLLDFILFYLSLSFYVENCDSMWCRVSYESPVDVVLLQFMAPHQ